MSGRLISWKSQADHYRQLASWTSDERTRHILTEMARELEEREADDAMSGADEPAPQPVPRSHS